MTELQIINAMLKSIGQMPVSSADSAHPFAITAKATLDDINEDVQSEGFWFNRSKNMSISPDEAGKIILPSTVLSVDSVDRSKMLVQRGNVLYDIANSTDVFTEREVLDIVFMIDVDSIPTTAAAYIKRRCVYEFFLDQDGEQKKLDKYERLMQDAMVRFGAEKIRYADVSIIDNPTFKRLMGRFSMPEYASSTGDKTIWVKQ